ncbi:MAG: hypothetical protein ACI89J_002312 [Hyphomicrobiaceae bacterium]|jgi:hypothetical protein
MVMGQPCDCSADIRVGMSARIIQFLKRQILLEE